MGSTGSAELRVAVRKKKPKQQNIADLKEALHTAFSK